MRNIFIEGMQGAGKSTLANRLAALRPDYRVYREGDLSLVELAWCAWMPNEDYATLLAQEPSLAESIAANTMQEGDHQVVAYTRVPGDQAFFRRMEAWEIYNGRIPYEDFRRIILTRYRAYQGKGNIFECSLFQNTVETMMLYYRMPEEAILDFFRQVWAVLKEQAPLILWLDVPAPEASLACIKAERVDSEGNPVWFHMLLEYLNHSPYGQQHPFASLQDVADHMKRRALIEKRIMATLMPGAAMILPARTYDLQTIARLM